MALSTRLMMRQGQALVMTPQLLQAIKLLQFSHLELAAFVQDELDRNPLLERADDRDPGPEAAPAIDRFAEAEQAREGAETQDWASSELAVDSGQLSAELGTDVSNAFDSDAPPTPAAPSAGLVDDLRSFVSVIMLPTSLYSSRSVQRIMSLIPSPPTRPCSTGDRTSRWCSTSAAARRNSSGSICPSAPGCAGL